MLFLPGVAALLPSLFIPRVAKEWDYSWGIGLTRLALMAWWCGLVVYRLTRKDRMHPKLPQAQSHAEGVWPPPPKSDS